MIKRGTRYLGLWLILLGIYGLTSSWQLYAQDEEEMFRVSTSLAEHASFNLNAPNTPATYSKYGPLQSILAVPLYMVGDTLTQLQPKAATWLVRIPGSWFNISIVAANAMLVALITALLGYEQSSIWSGIAYGLGSMAWIYSKTFFAEPLTSFFLLLGLYLALHANRTSRKWWLYVLSGLCSMLAILAKIHAATLIPFIALWILIDTTQHQANRKSLVGAGLLWVCGCLIGLGLFGWYQWALFGNPLSSGYGSEGQNGFTHDLWQGIYGLTFSWGRGIFWYQPLLLLLPWSLVKFARTQRIVAWLVGIMFIGQIAFYARWWAWDGAGSWGPRFLLIGMPFWFVILGSLFTNWNLVRWLRFSIYGLILWTAWVQILGLSISINASIAYNSKEDERNFSFTNSALMTQQRLFLHQMKYVGKRAFSQNAIILDNGFSYSEGNRDLSELFPRWSEPKAQIQVRSENSSAIAMNIFTCRPNNGNIGSVTITVDTTTLQLGTVCPQRTFHVFVPSQVTNIAVDSSAWNPVDMGIDRQETLGSYFFALQGLNNNGTMNVVGRSIPVPPMPNGITKLRQWYRDYRYEHWDYWWWYLAHSQLSTSQKWTFGIMWLVLNLGFITVGIRLLRYRRVNKTKHDEQ